MATNQRATIDQVFIFIGSVATVILLITAGLMWWGYSFATSQVRTELASQKITFPQAGSVSLSAEEYPGLQRYGGQLVDDGVKARAYADDFIGKHIEKIAAGKTYAEISAEAQLDKSNTVLQAQKQTLFQGETLRGLLLNAYAFWTFGLLAKYAAITAFAGFVLMLVLVVLGLQHLKKVENSLSSQPKH